MLKRKTSSKAAATPARPKASTAQPKPPNDTDHDDKPPADHPLGERSSRRPSADDTMVNEGGRSSDEGDVETGTSEEDARSRRRDLGP